MLVTDRPGFEKVYGSNVKYSPYGVTRSIDGINYATYCGTKGCKNNDNFSSNWDGGSVYSLWDLHEGRFCYRKKGILQVHHLVKFRLLKNWYNSFSINRNP